MHNGVADMAVVMVVVYEFDGCGALYSTWCFVIVVHGNDVSGA